MAAETLPRLVTEILKWGEEGVTREKMKERAHKEYFPSLRNKHGVVDKLIDSVLLVHHQLKMEQLSHQT